MVKRFLAGEGAEDDAAVDEEGTAGPSATLPETSNVPRTLSTA